MPRPDAAQALGFQLTQPPAGFVDDPYPWYAALREHDPVHPLGADGVFLSRYDDALAVYRNPLASSDKKVEFRPKFGDSPLFEHHTTSLVFSDPPLHPRVRRMIKGALNQRAIAPMEEQVVALVDRLLGDLSERGTVDFIEDFAARIPVEVIGNLLAVPHADRGPLRGWSIAILSGLEPAPSAELLERGNRAVSAFGDENAIPMVGESIQYQSNIGRHIIDHENRGTLIHEGLIPSRLERRMRMRSIW